MVVVEGVVIVLIQFVYHHVRDIVVVALLVDDGALFIEVLGEGGTFSSFFSCNS